MAHLSLVVDHQAARNKTNALLVHLLWQYEAWIRTGALGGQMLAAKSIAIAAPKKAPNKPDFSSGISFVRSLCPGR
jgi:hypothetical protein